MSGGSSQAPTQSTTTQVSPQAQQLFNLAYPNIANFAASPPPQRYQGSTVAGFDPLQTAGQEEYIRTAQRLASDPNSLANWAAEGVRGLPNQLKEFQGTDPFANFEMSDIRPDLNWNMLSSESLWNPAMNPALNQAILAAQRPLYQQLTEQVLPNVRSGGVTAGGYGGSRQGIAEGLAAGRTAQTAGDVGAKMAMDAYNANLQAQTQAYLGNINALNARYATNVGGANQRYGTNVGAETARYGQNINAMLAAYGMAPTLENQQIMMQLLPAQAMSNVGDVRQAMAQARLTGDVNAWNYDQLAPFLQSQEVMSLIQGLPGATTTSTGSVPPSDLASAPAAILGGAATGAALGSAFPVVGTGIGAGVGAGAAALPFIFRR